MIESYVDWHRRQRRDPLRTRVLRRIWDLGIEYSRAQSDPDSIVLRVVPRIILSLRTNCWHTVNHGPAGRGLADLVRFLAGRELPSVRTNGNLSR